MSKDIFRQLTNGARFEKKTSLFKNAKDQKQINDEDDFDKLKSQDRIHVIGEDIPDAIDSFEKMKESYNLNSLFMDNLSKAGFKKPTPVQMQAIPLMMDKRELICCSFTGSGKCALALNFSQSI